MANLNGTNGTIVRFESTSGPFYWYRQSELVVFGNRFYSSGGHCCDLNTKIFQTALDQTPVPVASVKLNSASDKVFPQKYWIFIEFPIEFEVSPFSHLALPSNKYCILDPEFEHGVFFDRLTAPIKKIQQAMARYSRPKVQAKRLALAMSTHGRLGQSSTIQVLGSDLLQTIFGF